MRCLHLLVPGLFWPDTANPHPYAGLRLPCLETLLGKGDRTPGRGGVETWLATTHGFEAGTAPLAAVARWGSAPPVTAESWMCADPVHLEPRGAEVFLTAGEVLDITADEAGACVAALNDFFREDDLAFEALRPDRWVLRGPAARMRLTTTPLSETHGRGIDPLLPGGDDARPWLRRLNEAQMLLHAHEVNTAREARGQPAINSVWFSWAGPHAAPKATPFTDVFSTDPLAAGIARAAGATVHAEPEQLQPALAAATRGQTLLHLGSIGRSAARADLGQWQAALAWLDAEVLPDALLSLRNGIIDTLALTGFAGRTGMTITLRRRHLLRFWRRPLALGTALGSAAAPAASARR
ncbi:MAG: hypothetical protein U1F52_19285 [Burkholderiales bacterium]